MIATINNKASKSFEESLYFPRATTAIYAALKSFSSSGKIIIPSTICLDPIFASYYANYEVVFVGIKGFQLELKKVIQILDDDPEINAILLPFLYGYPIEGLEEFWNQINSREILVIEDLAQTLGPSHFIGPQTRAKLVTIHSCGKSKIIDSKRLGIASTLDTELHSAMKNLRPKDLLISENGYKELDWQYDEFYKIFLRTVSYEENWQYFYQTVWNSDPRLFIPFLSTPIKSTFSHDIKHLQSPEYKIRKRRHTDILELFRDFQDAVLPVKSDSLRPIWRTTIRLPNSDRNQLYDYLNSNGLFASKWYRAMHRYVPSYLAENSADLKSAEVFEEEVINFKIDKTMSEKTFINYRTAIRKWIFNRQS